MTRPLECSKTTLNSSQRCLKVIDTFRLLQRLGADSEWCSAVVAYDPRTKKILATFVGIPDGTVFFAVDAWPGAWKLDPEQRIKPLTGPSGVADFSGTLAFYGQKFRNLRSVFEFSRIIEALAKFPSARILNLAGNPILVRLVDGYKPFDLVVEAVGQLPHGVVPGAFIAERAGAIIRDFNNKTIDWTRSLERPADPKSRIRYVAAASHELASKFFCLISEVYQIEAVRVA